MKSNFFLRFFLLVIWLDIFSAVFTSLHHISQMVAKTIIPTTWDVLYGDIESGRLDKWQLSSSIYPVVAPRVGHYGLVVDVSSEGI
jgi:hypothetical protein